jgi:hypothetical protein
VTTTIDHVPDDQDALKAALVEARAKLSGANRDHARAVSGLYEDYRSAHYDEMGDPETIPTIDEMVKLLSTPSGRLYCANRSCEIEFDIADYIKDYAERPTKYFVTLASPPGREFCVISTCPWGAWKVIGEFATTDEAYNKAMSIKRSYPPHDNVSTRATP